MTSPPALTKSHPSPASPALAAVPRLSRERGRRVRRNAPSHRSRSRSRWPVRPSVPSRASPPSWKPVAGDVPDSVPDELR